MAVNEGKTQTEETVEKVHIFKFTYFYLLLDISLRWIILGGKQFDLINDWVFWISQIIIIPVLVLFNVEKTSTEVQRKFNIKSASNVQPKNTITSAMFTLLIVAIGSYITFSLYITWHIWVRVIFSLFGFLVYGFYIIVVYFNSVRDELAESSIATLEDEEALTDNEWRDENDRVIIKLETDKISLSQRVEAYSLESTLFGALAFSGFVTIVASEKPVLAGVQILIEDILAIFNMILRFEFDVFEPILNDIARENTLLAAIAAQTLVSAVFFLSVIISRLRFNDILKRVDYSTRLASAYNQKEEEVLNLILQDSSEERYKLQEERLQDLKSKISVSIYYAEHSMSDLVPIVMYMSVFRNLGVISFLLILITSALWVSKVLAMIFTGLSILAYVYPFLDKWIRDRKLSGISFFQRGKRFFPHLARK